MAWESSDIKHVSVEFWIYVGFVGTTWFNHQTGQDVKEEEKQAPETPEDQDDGTVKASGTWGTYGVHGLLLGLVFDFVHLCIIICVFISLFGTGMLVPNE